MHPLLGKHLNEFSSLRKSIPKINTILDGVYGFTSEAQFDPNKLSYSREEMDSLLAEIKRLCIDLDKRIQILEDA